MTNSNPHPDSYKIFILLLKNISEQKKLTHQQIADSAGVDRVHITRFFALKYAPRLDIYLKIAAAIGVIFTFEDKDEIADLQLALKLAADQLKMVDPSAN